MVRRFGGVPFWCGRLKLKAAIDRIGARGRTAQGRGRVETRFAIGGRNAFSALAASLIFLVEFRPGIGPGRSERRLIRHWDAP